MIKEATMNTQKLVAHSVSSVPSTTDWTELRSVCRILPYKPYSCFFTFPSKNICGIGIKPMGQTPIENTRELPSLTRFHILKVFNTDSLSPRQVKLIKSMTYHRCNFGVGMLLPLAKLLDAWVNICTKDLPIREIEAIFIVGIHAYNRTNFFQNRFRFLQNKGNKQPIFLLTELYRFRELPTFGDIFVNNLCGMYGNYHAWCARTNKFYGIVKRAIERFNPNKMGIQSDNVFMEIWSSISNLGCRAHCFFRLFCQGLGKPKRDTKLISTLMNSIGVSKISSEILSLPKKVYKILCRIVAKVKELNECIYFALVEVVKINTDTSPHCSGVLVCLNHYLKFYHTYLVLSNIFQGKKNLKYVVVK